MADRLTSASAGQVDALLQQLNSPDAFERRSAANSIAALGLVSDEVTRALGRVAHTDPNQYVVRTAKDALDRLGLPLLDAEPAASPTTKRCPYCAEEIQAAAIVCKHCGRDLPTGTPSPGPANRWSASSAAQTTTPCTVPVILTAIGAVILIAWVGGLCSSASGGSSYSSGASAEWLPLSGNVWSGVKVYYGENKAYAFEILGGSESCTTIASGRGLRVQFPNGSIEWKDRQAFTQSDIYFVRSIDPALDAQRWEIYVNC